MAQNRYTPAYWHCHTNAVQRGHQPHTAAAQRGQGIAEAALLHILETARTRGLRRLFLETGSQPGFEPARKLYAKHGFAACGPFGDYREDPNSVFMTLELQPEASVP